MTTEPRVREKPPEDLGAGGLTTGPVTRPPKTSGIMTEAEFLEDQTWLDCLDARELETRPESGGSRSGYTWDDTGR